MKILRFGDKGEEVKRVQEILKQQGFFKGEPLGNFQSLTLAAVKYFQSTHIGPDGKFLEIDGIVGSDTWWALDHPSVKEQRNFIEPCIPDGLSPMRKKALEIALIERGKGVHEVPDGSNWGPEIKKYGGSPGWAWCCLFATWCYRQAGMFNIKEPSTYDFWKLAEKNGWFYPLDSKDPRAYIPGNAFLIQHKGPKGNWTHTGHIALIARVAFGGECAPNVVSPAPSQAMKFNTVAGNEGNRVKFGIRTIKCKDLVGFINPFPEEEQPLDFERGIIQAQSVERATTR